MQPPNSPGFMQSRQFVHSALPPSMRPNDSNIGPNNFSNNTYVGGFRPPYVQYPGWSPYSNNPPVPYPKLQPNRGYYQTVRPVQLPPPVFSSTIPPPSIIRPHVSNPQVWTTSPQEFDTCIANGSKEDLNDQVWVNLWLRHLGKECLTAPSSSGVPVHSKSKVWKVKRKLQGCLIALKELEVLEMELTANYKDLVDLEWSKKMKEAESKGILLQTQLNSVNEDEVKEIKAILSKRCKKRAREKRRRELEKENCLMKAENRKKLHVEIDTWLERQQAQVELLKQEELMKQEADAVLWGVRRKQSEGRKILALLSALVKLHHVRSKRNEDSSDPIPLVDKEQFIKIIEKLVHLWESQMKDYEAEEKTLRIMLHESPGKDDSNIEPKRSDLNKTRRNNREWQVALFGNDSIGEEMVVHQAEIFKQFYLQPSQNLNDFIDVRRRWDQFTSNSPAASSIPIGWVIPKEASSAEWKKLTK